MIGVHRSTDLAAESGVRWWEHATCRDEDPELFFPAGTSGPALLQAAQAKAICWECPVREACLADAIEQRTEFGIFGGFDADQRRRLAAGLPLHCDHCGNELTGIGKNRFHDACRKFVVDQKIAAYHQRKRARKDTA